MDGSGFGIGAPVRRKEDLRLLTGRGNYSDDFNLPGQARAAIVRSPHAHARILRIDTAVARACPGVVAIYTGADLVADHVGPIPPDYAALGPIEVQMTMPDRVLLNRDGSAMFPSPFHILAIGRARYVGDAVAMVVAETVAQAKDAAEQVVVEYESLPPVTATAQAARPGAPAIWDTGTNVMLDAEIGNQEATEAAFAEAAHIATLDTWIQRVTGVPMEARSAVGVCDAITGRCTLYAGSGGVVRQKGEIAGMLGLAPEMVRVVARDIGGNFGTKNSLFPEYPLVVYAARKLGRPVKWTCDRSEAFLSDYQGRDLVARVELALDAEGKFLALRGFHMSNVGAYASSIIPLRKGVGIATGLYTIPHAYLRAYAVVSNTPPTIPYRSAGRPEAMYLIERLVDIAARQTGIDPVELRARNLIQPDQLPYTNATGVTYDNGDYPLAMAKAVALSDWAGFPARRAESQARGKLRGIGLGNYIEMTMGYPREWSRITVLPQGIVEIAIGTLASGQGHETSFAQCVAEWFGVAFEQVRLVQGDTDIVPVGGGSHSGRSMRFASVVMGKATDGVLRRGQTIVGHIFDVPPDQVQFSHGRFHTPGGERSLGLFEVAAAAYAQNDLPDELRGPLADECDETFKVAGYPYGAAVAEVEIDPETGMLELCAWTAIDDVGRAVNPLILHGQTHGAAAQGIGQAFLEHCTLDHETGQVLAASFMDYAMPRADNLPSFRTELMEIPSPTNKLGVRAGGEGGTTPALGAAVNAVVDALAEFGVTHIDMPTTPEKIWRAIRGAHA